MGGDLLFVHQTQSSGPVKARTAGQKSQLLSHVQANRRRAEKKSAQKPQKPWSRQTATLVVGDAGLDEPESEIITPVKDKRQQRNNKHGGRPLRRLPNQLPFHYPAYNSADPFHCTVAGPDAGLHALLRCTLVHACRSNFLAEAFAPLSICVQEESTRHDAIYDRRLRECVQDPTLMYSTLAYGSCFLAWAKGMLEEGKSVDFYLGKALFQVRNRLSSPGRHVDDWLVLSVYALAITEMWSSLPALWPTAPEKRLEAQRRYSSGIEASRIHRGVLPHLVATVGGWARFDPYILESSILVDKYLAISELQPPVIPLTFDPGPISHELRSQIGGRPNTLPTLGMNLRDLAVSTQLKAILQDTIDFSRLAHSAWLRGGIGNELESWFFRRLQALTYRLLSHYHEDDSLLDRSVCLTTLIFVLNATAHQGPSFASQYAASHLHALFVKTAADQQIDEGLRFWIYGTAAMVQGAFPEKPWFECGVRAYLHLFASEEELSRALEPYLYLPLKQGLYLSQMFNSLIG